MSIRSKSFDKLNKDNLTYSYRATEKSSGKLYRSGCPCLKRWYTAWYCNHIWCSGTSDKWWPKVQFFTTNR